MHSSRSHDSRIANSYTGALRSDKPNCMQIVGINTFCSVLECNMMLYYSVDVYLFDLLNRYIVSYLSNGLLTEDY